jgi:D-alanyl-D-alanine carboxypeptidase/D-alanyl-D-alanine-endopeptidase (penicillin-binding protein 4)
VETKIIKALIAALTLGVIFSAPVSAFDPLRATTVFTKLAADPNLKNPSVILIDASTNEVVFESNSYAMRKPASTLKLLSGVSVARYLDPEMRFQTSLALSDKKNSVVIQGEMDPWATFNAYNAKRLGQTSLKYLAYRAHVELESQAGAPVKTMTIYYNGIYDSEAKNMKVYLKTRKVYVILKPVSALEAQNLTVEPLINSASPTVQQMTHFFIQWSDNTLSERLARIAAKAAGYNGSAEGISNVFKTVLAEMEIDSSKLVAKDGSGLSHENRVSAHLLGELLAKIQKDPRYAGVIESLPDGGVNGTLRKRFLETATEAIGLVHAKTGTLNGTVTLAGYIDSGDREYIFVVIADKLRRTYSATELARDTLDRYLVKLAAPREIIVETTTAETVSVVSSITP